MQLPHAHDVPGSRSGFLFATGLALVLFAAPLSGGAQTLLAGWTFNNQTSQTTALTADEGLLASSAVLSTSGSGGSQTLTLNGNGTVSLGTGEVLYSSAINSVAYPSLLSNVTIYASFTLTATGSAVNSAAFGLTTSTPVITSASGSYVGTLADGYEILTMGPPEGVRAVGTLSDGTTTLSNPGTPSNALTLGSTSTAAIVFSSNGSSYTSFDRTNGASDSKTATSTLSLDAITDLAIGRILSTGSDGALTINEIRVYEGALTAAQIDAIPEPGTTAWFLAGATLLALPGLRKFRGVSRL